MNRPWLKHYDPDVPHKLNIPETLISDFLQHAAASYPRQTATVFMGARLTYRQLYDLVENFAAALYSLGVRQGDRVAIMLPNSPQVVIAYYAVLRLGAVTVMTNPLYVERELEHQWGDAGAKLVIALDLMFEKTQAACQTLGIETIVVTGVQDFAPLTRRFLIPLELRRRGVWVDVPYSDTVLSFRKLCQQKLEAPPRPDITSEDLACLQYTGGTTGLPKGAMLSHFNLVASVTQIREFLLQGHRETEDRAVAILPIFHVYGMVVMNLATNLAATLVLLPRFEIKDLVEAIKQERPTFFLGVPALYVAVLNFPGIDDVDLTSINTCFSGGAPLPVNIIEDFESRTGARIAEAYGMTEASSVTHVNPRQGLRKYGTVGVPIIGTDARVVNLEDPTQDVDEGEPGELLLRGPQIMKAYWNQDDESQQVFVDDVWLRTGDIATMDEDGYFTIVDRKKDMILSAGFNVYPREVEEVLYKHPKVEHAAVIGVPHKLRGERITAYVQLKAGEKANGAEIRKFCRENLADYKVPRAVVFRDELPISPAGKVLRRALREEDDAVAQVDAAEAETNAETDPPPES